MTILSIEEVKEALAYIAEPSAVPDAMLMLTMNGAESTITSRYGVNPDPLDHTLTTAEIAEAQTALDQRKMVFIYLVSAYLRNAYEEIPRILLTLGTPTEIG